MSEKMIALGNESWPVLLVDLSGSILRANTAAANRFGPAVEGGAALLGSIWAGQNGVAPQHFLAEWLARPRAVTALAWRDREGQVFQAQACICVLKGESTPRFVVQLLPEAGAMPAEGDGAKQKLECALQLARTVALDFNNALTSILGHTSLVLSQMEGDHVWRGSLLEVEKSAARAAEIANDLGTFSRQEKGGRGQSLGNLNGLVGRTVEVFRGSQKGRVEWRLELGEGLYATRYEEAKLQQGLLKVFENAVESLPGHGVIRVRTGNVEAEGELRDGNVLLAGGTYVCVEVTDSGAGILPELVGRVFEPFFTTKGGAHRGLGLALVYGIMTNHGGGVAVSSQVGQGTAVRLYLPAEKRVAAESGPEQGDLRGKETVLFVDDEELLRKMAEVVLSAYGYQVLTAESGPRALEVLSENSPVELLITDLVMPGMSGRELMEHARAFFPGIRVMSTSGYVRGGEAVEDASYLQKPFTAQELLSRVKQVLRSDATG